jgi:5-amino-6-(5-phosphoribosylamino)uracil reductase
LALFLEAQVVQELFLTLCPLLIGGHDTPGLVGGVEFSHSPVKTELLSLEQVGEELFLHLKVNYRTDA